MFVQLWLHPVCSVLGGPELAQNIWCGEHGVPAAMAGAAGLDGDQGSFWPGLCQMDLLGKDFSPSSLSFPILMKVFGKREAK